MQAIRLLVVTVLIYILELLAGGEGKYKNEKKRQMLTIHGLHHQESGYRAATCSQKEEKRRANADRQGLSGRN